MHKRLIIVGGGGHGKVVADVAKRIGYKEILFLDDAECCGTPDYKVVGKIDEIDSFNDVNTVFVIAIGNNDLRKSISEKYNVQWATLIDPFAIVSDSAVVGEGSVVCATAVVNTSTKIGKHCIINTGAVVEHDNVISDYAHVAPSAVLGGGVVIGEMTHVGLGVKVRQGIKICNNCVLGVGSVVVKDIENSGVYVGVPAKLLS